MSNKQAKREKVTKDMVPEGFTLSLALVDAVPVLLFAVAIVILGVKAGTSPLIIIGGLLMLIAGAIKVLWKVIVATKQKNVFWMFQQMPPVMGIGAILLIVGCILSRAELKAAFTGIGTGSIVFFAIWGLCMILMSIFAVKLDQSDVKSNWIEQGTNGVGELALCIALALL